MLAFLLCLLIITMVLQSHMTDWALEAVSVSLKTDHYLIEPGHMSTLNLTIANHSRLPILFLRVTFNMPRDTEIAEDQPGSYDRLERSLKYTYNCFLMPMQQVNVPIQFSLPARGVYSIGTLNLYAGDFLGLREDVAGTNAAATVVVVPKKLDDASISEISGGLMGDISVRRFIHEDPILVAGYREYTGREPMKNISWPRSLASAQLMVRQFDFTSEQKVTVLLSIDGGSEEELEQCFSLTRTACEYFERFGIPYSLISNADLYTTVGRVSSMSSGLGYMHLNLIKEVLGRATYLSRFSFDELLRTAALTNDVPETFLVIAPGSQPELVRTTDMLSAYTGAPVQILKGVAS